MGSVKINNAEKSILSQGEIIWDKGVWMTAKSVFAVCDTEDQIKAFVEECESNIRDYGNAKLEWNGSVHSCRGDVFGYLWYFKSEIMNKVIKVGLNINMDGKIVVGYMNFTLDDEARKYHKHVGKKEENLTPEQDQTQKEKE